MAKSQAVCLDEVVGYFDELEDPRSEVNQKHPLVILKSSNGSSDIVSNSDGRIGGDSPVLPVAG